MLVTRRDARLDDHEAEPGQDKHRVDAFIPLAGSCSRLCARDHNTVGNRAPGLRPKLRAPSASGGDCPGHDLIGSSSSPAGASPVRVVASDVYRRLLDDGDDQLASLTRSTVRTRVPAPLHFQLIAHPGACGKTRGERQNLRRGPEPAEIRDPRSAGGRGVRCWAASSNWPKMQPQRMGGSWLT